MSVGSAIALIGVCGTICGIIFGYVGYKRGEKKDTYADKKDTYYEGSKDGELMADTQYIKRRIDDVFLEQRDTNKSITTLSERVTRVEESAKQAHKRIDRIERVEEIITQ